MTSDYDHTRRQLLKTLSGVGTAGMVGLAGCANQPGNSNGSQNNSQGGTSNGSGSDRQSGNNSGDNNSGDGSGQQTALTVATSVEGSTSFRIGAVFGQYIRDNNLAETFSWNAVVSPGATGGYRMLDNGEAEIAGPSTYGLEASPGEGPFSEDNLSNFNKVRQIRGFFSVQPFVIVTQDSGISSWSDLKGKTISLGSAGAGTRVPSEQMIDLSFGRDNATLQYIGYSEQPSALRSGRVDAIFGYVNNARTASPIAPGWMQELDATTDWTHIQYPENLMSKFEEQLPYASTFTVSGDTFFKSYTDTITAYNLTYAWTCHADLPTDVVREITKISYENGKELLKVDNAMGFFPDPDRFLATMHPDVPVHQGAYDYYTEEGMWEKYDLTPPPNS